eukprot:TRINITY_DN15932_c0_g1_i1.p1 TRINITY_DN15932_c0_g1~~TRINITY_DN15932_c0_g1_i1.p1  ORF type:complete len:136 (+),score=22.96 TRINITY_DN15932_c0_g1_i1:24-410(+)
MAALWCRGLLRMSAVRLAPKKAGKGKGAADAGAAVAVAADSTQLFNIYAGRPDEVIRPDEWYPKWLWDLDKPNKSYGELAMMFIHGINIETAGFADYQRFLRQHRKLVIRINNLRLKKSKRSANMKIA